MVAFKNIYVRPTKAEMTGRYPISLFVNFSVNSDTDSKVLIIYTRQPHTATVCYKQVR